MFLIVYQIYGLYFNLQNKKEDFPQSHGLSSYYEMFPSDTKDKALLIEYITLTEVILISSFKFNIYQSSPVESLLSKKMKKDLVD